MDIQYYSRRREQELAMEAAATSPEAASAHSELATVYAERVRRLIAREGHIRPVRVEPVPQVRVG